jgi:rhamnose transport system permease protein
MASSIRVNAAGDPDWPTTEPAILGRAASAITGLIAALAAIIYTARLGQAKADAGTGYELFAITAVVLGGTSIFGGKGSVTGTLLGVALIAVLKSGLATLPVVIRMNAAEEISGLLTGALLLVALGIGVCTKAWGQRRNRSTPAVVPPQPLQSLRP